ncbi:MAG: hypothetical protein GTO41_18030, partial [Burkholderiales bacterium]|nr:hypothetical protein [Burkholderiales bacterium]
MAEVTRELIDHLELEATVVGPAPAPISKLRGKYRYHFLLQADNDVPLVELVRRVQANAPQTAEAQFVYDIDPLD